jgi:hypothetical protein
LTSIVFGYHFNRRVDNLPLSLKSIVFGRTFNQIVDNLPSTVTSIVFGWHFDQKISQQFFDNLPNLKTLKISSKHDYILKKLNLNNIELILYN